MEKVSAKNKDFFKEKRNIIIVVLVSFLLIGVFVLLAILNVNKRVSCEKLANEIVKKLDFEYKIEYDKLGNDSEFGMLNSSTIYEVEDAVISIIMFDSNEIVKRSIKYQEDYQSYLSEYKDTLIGLYDSYKSLLEPFKDYVYDNGIYLIRINSKYEEKYDEYKKIIDDVISKYNNENIKDVDKDEVDKFYEDKLVDYKRYVEEIKDEMVDDMKQNIKNYLPKIESCKGSDCKKYLDAVLKYKDYPEIADEIKLVEDKYNEVINRKNDMANSIAAKVSEIEGTLNETDYNDIKKQISGLDDEFYDDYKNVWNDKLNSIEIKVYKKNSKNYKYGDVLRNYDDYMGKKAYWFGVIQQKVSSYEYRVGVDCSRNRFADSGYVCSNTIYVNYLGNVRLIEDDVVKMWGTMEGVKTYTSIFGANITIPWFYASFVELQ